MLSFLLFYGLIVGKYALICAMEIQKIHMVVHIFSGFVLFTESECIAELHPVVLLNFDLSCVTRVCCLVFRHAH